MGYTPITFIINQVSGQSSYLKSDLENNTGSTIPAFTPVRINTSGDLELVTVSSDTTLASIGITQSSISNGASGSVVTGGKIENFNLFDLGDYIYISKTGGLTDTPPSIGVGGFVAGDHIIRVGVVAKNQDNPSNKDLFVNIQVVGQL